MIGNIHSLETFGTVDGPGIRYVVFMQGCPLRCAYCHNPDSWDVNAGEKMSVDDLVKDIAKYTRYIDGITVSGGEPLLQIDFLIDLFKKVRELGLTTCIDTSGIVFNKDNLQLIDKLNTLMNVTDIIMLDIKHIDDISHKLLTGKSNVNILEFARYVDSRNVDMWLRYVLVPSINDDKETLLKWKMFADSMNNVKNIEILPYHRLGVEKYKNLGLEYRLDGILEPTIEQINLAKEILKLN